MPFGFSKDKLPTQLFINNEYVASKSQKTFSLQNPKDSSLVSDQIPLAGAEDVDAAVTAAEAAFPAWKRLGASQRRDILLKFADLIDENSVGLAELTRITLGAPYEAFGKFEAGLAANVRSFLCVATWSSLYIRLCFY